MPKGLHYSTGYSGPNIVLDLDIKDFRRRAKKLNGVEMPMAVSKALWNTAEKVRDAERKYLMRRTFFDSKRSRRKKFLATGIRHVGGKVAESRARSKGPVAIVYTAGRGNQVIPEHERGSLIRSIPGREREGSRLHVKQYLALPARGVKRNQKGQLDFSKYATASELANNHFEFKTKKGDLLWGVRTTRGERTRQLSTNKKKVYETRIAKPLKRRPRTMKRWNSKATKVVFLLFLRRRFKLKNNFPFHDIARRHAPRHFKRELIRQIDRAVQKKTYGRVM